MSDLHGFGRGEEIIHITFLNGHKRPVLLIGNKYMAKKIASFNDEECAKEFVKLLDRWLGLEEQNE